MSNKNAREYAYEILQEIFINDAYSNISINKVFSSNKIDEKDKRYITELVYGTIKNKIYLEHILKTYASGRVKPKTKVLLLMSIYQIIKMNKTPDFAAVNEAVNIAKKVAGMHTGKFVNGILRNIIRTFDIDTITYKNNDEKFIVENSCPNELYNILVKQYGKEKAQSIISSFNKKAGNSIRINYLKTTKTELMQFFADNQVMVTESKICEDCLLVSNLLLGSEQFKNGHYIVQDEASALVALTIGENVAANYNILDVCAAPGGKSLHIASKYINSNLISCDKYIHKLNLIENNKTKLAITNLTTQEQDATVLNKEFINNFDIVVCDVPCSGIGVIKNKPEIKYKITDSYVENIAKLQYEILGNSINYVKAGGVVIYSTCTIDKRENEENIKKFLAAHKNFKLEKININSTVKEEQTGVLNILPDEHNCDGFFIAKLRKLED